MTTTEPIPTGPAFSARLHGALAVLGEPVTTPEQRHGGWLLSLERAAGRVRTGITGLDAWTVARDVLQRAAADGRQSPEDRAELQDAAAVMVDAVRSLEAGDTPMLDADHLDLAFIALTCALADAHATGEPVAGHSALALLLAVGHASITLVHVLNSLPADSTPVGTA